MESSDQAGGQRSLSDMGLEVVLKPGASAASLNYVNFQASLGRPHEQPTGPLFFLRFFGRASGPERPISRTLQDTIDLAKYARAAFLGTWEFLFLDPHKILFRSVHHHCPGLDLDVAGVRTMKLLAHHFSVRPLNVYLFG